MLHAFAYSSTRRQGEFSSWTVAYLIRCHFHAQDSLVIDWCEVDGERGGVPMICFGARMLVGLI